VWATADAEISVQQQGGRPPARSRHGIKNRSLEHGDSPSSRQQDCRFGSVNAQGKHALLCESLKVPSGATPDIQNRGLCPGKSRGIGLRDIV